MHHTNVVTDKEIPHLIDCLKNNTALTMLVLPKDNEQSITTIQEAVNNVRKKNGLPNVEVKGESCIHAWSSTPLQTMVGP